MEHADLVFHLFLNLELLLRKDSQVLTCQSPEPYIEVSKIKVHKVEEKEN